MKLKFLTCKNFLKKIKRNDGDIEKECWLWTGSKTNNKYVKYGIITMDKKAIRAHRFSWIYFWGAIPKEFCVLHKCDNPLCVNPYHLFLGTRIDNNKDRDNKKRTKKVCGQKNGNSKLTPENIIEIRAMLSMRISLAQIARKFKVTYQNIQTIKKGWTWKD